MGTTKVSAARALLRILQAEGVDAIFGIPGGPLLPFYDELVSQRSIRVILVKHEQAAAFAAFAYAKITGRLGVCMATLGPGATNLIAGLPIAYVSNVPVLALTGQVQTTAFARGAHQESTGWFRTPNQEMMFLATTKHSGTCTDASRFCSFVRSSIRIAYSGRPGPAHLILPANILHKEVEFTEMPPESYRLSENLACDDTAIDGIAKRIATAKRPLLLAGERSWTPDAGLEIQQLGEQFQIPIVTDLSCKSIVDESSPVFLGCMGVLGHRAGEKYLKEKSDQVISIGQTFNEISTLSWDPAYGEEDRLIQIDSDPEEIGKVFPVAASAVGHMPTILQRLRLRLEQLIPPGDREIAQRRNLIDELKGRYPMFEARESSSEKVPMLPQRVVSELREAIPSNALILSDSSKWSRWLGRYFKASRRMIVSAHDYEPMGWAVAGAIGAKIACPELPIFCVSGDGAFLMSAMELATAANYDLAIQWIVMNDERLGIIHDLQHGLYGGRFLSTSYKNPDFVKFSESFGIRGVTVSQPGELRDEIKKGLAAKQSQVLDVRFDPEEIPPVRPRSLLITREMGLPNPKPRPELTRALIKLLEEK